MTPIEFIKNSMIALSLRTTVSVILTCVRPSVGTVIVGGLLILLSKVAKNGAGEKQVLV